MSKQGIIKSKFFIFNKKYLSSRERSIAEDGGGSLFDRITCEKLFKISRRVLHPTLTYLQKQEDIRRC